MRLAGGHRRHHRRRLAVGVLRGGAHHRRRRQDPAEPCVLRRPSDGELDQHDPAPARHQHLVRLQRLRRAQSLHRRHPLGPPAADGAGLPVEAAGRGPARHHDPATGSRHERPRRLPPLSPPVAVGRIGRVAGLGAAVHRMGRAARPRHRCLRQRRPRGTPGNRRRPSSDPLGRTRRVLVGADARHRRVVHRRGRQRGVLLGQHGVLAGADGGPQLRRPGVGDGRLQGPVQEGPGLRHRSHRRTDEHLVGSPDRPTREPHDRRELQSWRLPPHRQTGHQRRRRLHRPPPRPLDLRRHRHRVRRRPRGRCDAGRLRVRRLRLHLPRRAPLPHRVRRNAGLVRDPRHGTGRPLHPHHGRPSAQTRRTLRDRVHRARASSTPGTRCRWPGSPPAMPCSGPTPRPAEAR